MRAVDTVSGNDEWDPSPCCQRGDDGVPEQPPTVEHNDIIPFKEVHEMNWHPGSTAKLVSQSDNGQIFRGRKMHRIAIH